MKAAFVGQAGVSQCAASQCCAYKFDKLQSMVHSLVHSLVYSMPICNAPLMHTVCTMHEMNQLRGRCTVQRHCLQQHTACLFDYQQQYRYAVQV